MISERTLLESDHAILKDNIAADHCHADWMTPEFFSEPNTQSLVFEDEQGPIFYLRMSSALRIHIQFCKTEDKERIRKALVAAGLSIVPKARQNGYKQILYESASKTLTWFCRKYLGFTSSPDEQVLWLDTIPKTAIESSREHGT